MSHLWFTRDRAVLLSRKELGDAPIKTTEVFEVRKTLGLLLFIKSETPKCVTEHRIEITGTIFAMKHIESFMSQLNYGKSVK